MSRGGRPRLRELGLKLHHLRGARIGLHVRLDPGGVELLRVSLELPHVALELLRAPLPALRALGECLGLGARGERLHVGTVIEAQEPADLAERDVAGGRPRVRADPGKNLGQRGRVVGRRVMRHHEVPVDDPHPGVVGGEVGDDPVLVERVGQALAAEVVGAELRVVRAGDPAVAAMVVEHVCRSPAAHRLEDHARLAEHDVGIAEHEVRRALPVAVRADVAQLEPRAIARALQQRQALTVHVVAERHRDKRPRARRLRRLEPLDVDRLGEAHDLGDGLGERADPPLHPVVEDDDGRDEARQLRRQLEVEDVAVRHEDLRRLGVAGRQLAGDGAVLDEQHVGRRRQLAVRGDDPQPECLGRIRGRAQLGAVQPHIVSEALQMVRDRDEVRLAAAGARERVCCRDDLHQRAGTAVPASARTSS